MAARIVWFLCTCVMLSGWLDSVTGLRIMSLNGDDWMVTNSNQSIKAKATVPGSIYTDLMRAGVIGEPYYRFNDDVYRWVAHESWTFKKTVHLEKVPPEQEVDLVFQGVDTVATLKINGKMVAQMNNMFRRYTVPVKSFLQAGDNEVTLDFVSPVTYAKDQSAAYPYDVPPDCPGPEAHGECHNNFIRKEASSFSWDWGPSFPTVGIWKNVILVMYNSAVIYQVTTEVRPDKERNTWMVTGNAYFDVGKRTQGRMCAAVLDNGKELGTFCDNICDPGPEHNFCTFDFFIDGRMVQRWWPNGQGQQVLYTFSVNWTSHDAAGEQEVDFYWRKIAFRTVDLIQTPIQNSTGMTFYFNINDKPIFMKGSNWIPTDSFQERITPEYLRQLLTSAKVANMNMLRVWGGGVYESDVFYNLADELGILIWQDFMFACALYPTDVKFLENVAQEVTYQVRRLKHHPSIAIWAGNNENEGALASNWYHVKTADMPRYYADYKKLYLQTIQEIVEAADQSRPFVSSSPSNGYETMKEGGIAKKPQDEHWGDVHYYNYNSDGWNYTIFPTPRFASEFGFQSWCSEETLKPVSVPEDLKMKSKFTDHRQHHPDGNPQLVSEISQHLNMTNTGDASKDFLNFIYLTQINQAVSIKTEAEHYRRMQSSLTKDGRGFTMGSLYWQLNDIWQAPTWASTEYGGKWKMLHYYARNFYSPVLISPVLRPDQTIDVYIVNDSLPVFKSDQSSLKMYETYKDDNTLRFEPQKLEDFDLKVIEKHRQNNINKETKKQERSLEVAMYSWDSLTPLKTWTFPFASTPEVASEIVYHTDVETLLKESKCPSVNHCFLDFGLDDCSTTNWLLLSNFKTAQGLKKADLQVKKVARLNSTALSVTLTTDNIAPFVWLELPGYHGYFSDNGFIMVVPSVTLTYTSFVPMSSEIAITPKSFTVKSLMDIY